MSWDIMLVRTRTNTEPMEEIDESVTVPFLPAEVISTLKTHFPDITEDSPEWLTYEGGTFAIAFNLAALEESIMLHVDILDEPEDAVLGTIRELCGLFNCRAFDTTAAEFLEP